MEVLTDGVNLPVDLDLERLKKVSDWLLLEKGLGGRSVNVILVDNGFIRELNRKYRGVDSSTDVLTFDLSGFPSFPDETTGEIYVSLESAQAQAQEMNVSLGEEVARLVIHGLLHLVGMDHRTASERREMERETERYLKEVLGYHLEGV